VSALRRSSARGLGDAELAPIGQARSLIWTPGGRQRSSMADPSQFSARDLWPAEPAL